MRGFSPALAGTESESGDKSRAVQTLREIPSARIGAIAFGVRGFSPALAGAESGDKSPQSKTLREARGQKRERDRRGFRHRDASAKKGRGWSARTGVFFRVHRK